MRTLPVLAALALVSGCYEWGDLPVDNNTSMPDRWEPASAFAAGSHLYVPLDSASGEWVALAPDEEPIAIELGGEARKLVRTPDGGSLVGFVDSSYCEDDTGLSLAECDDDDIVSKTHLVWLQDGAILQEIEVPSSYNTLEFSDNGTFLLARLDLDGEVSWSGLVDLTAVLLVNLVTEEIHEVAVGFSAEATAFSETEDLLLVLSESEVALVDTTTEVPEVSVTYPLTLDADDVVEPVGVAIEPDGRYAMISVRGSSDLYVLDLESPSVNIVALSSQPTALDVDVAHDRSVVVYSSASRVDIIEHDYFDVEEIDLDEAVSRIEIGDESTLLWRPGGSDVYRLAYDDDNDVEVIEYVLRNPAARLMVSSDEQWAAAVTTAESATGDLYDRHPGVEILDLSSDETYPRMLEDSPQLVAMDEVTDGDGVITDLGLLIKMTSNDRLYRLDLYTGEETTLDLDGEVIDIGMLPDGGVWMTLEGSLGRVAFVDSATTEVTEVTNFASPGLLDIYDTAEEE